MREYSEAVVLRKALCAWFDSPLGRSLQALEMNRLRGVLPGLYGPVAIQLGRIGKLDLLDASIATTRILVDLAADKDCNGGRNDAVRAAAESEGLVHPLSLARAFPELLPFDARSVDVALLPHTLDFSSDSHQVLREVSRVLVPEGHVVITGFNPLSLWGLRRAFTRTPRPAPWCANFFRLARIKDWLKLLDLELTQGSMLYYRPPLQHEGMMERAHFLDRAGDRWWPMMAAAYLVVAKKRVVAMTPLRLKWKKEPAVSSAATEPAARRGVVVPFRAGRPRQRVRRG